MDNARSRHSEASKRRADTALHHSISLLRRSSLPPADGTWRVWSGRWGLNAALWGATAARTLSAAPVRARCDARS